MEIIDAKRSPPKSVSFLASEINQAHFGFNLMNAQIHAVLRQYIAKQSAIDLIFETEIDHLIQFENHVAIRAKDEEFQARLLIGADGRHSATRHLAKIEADFEAINQSAQVFIATHEKPHQNTSTEVHFEGGPFTLVPRTDIDGQAASAIVWMDHPEAANIRQNMSDAEFNEALNARSFGVRGKLQKHGDLGVFPMLSMCARQFSKHRIAILGEAAHIVPPIGAQGLNMSLRDIESLVRVCERGALDFPQYLNSWGRQRMMDVRLRKNGIRLLNNISMGGDKTLSEKLRHFGLEVLEKPTPLKSKLMRLGLGQ